VGIGVRILTNGSRLAVESVIVSALADEGGRDILDARLAADILYLNVLTKAWVILRVFENVAIT
jgi:hypothetical protein